MVSNGPSDDAQKIPTKVTLFERETIGAFSQASSINSGFLHTEPTTDPSGKDDWNSFSSSLSMTVYKYLDSCCPAKAKCSKIGKKVQKQKIASRWLHDY